jgi:thiamine transporter
VSPAERTRVVDPRNLIRVIPAKGCVMSGNGTRTNTRELAEIAVTVALSVVLNYIKIYQLPWGGSITLGSMVPIMLLAYRRGVKVGIMAGIVFGLVQMALEGYIYYPLQIILDYPLAFACLGLAGLFKKQPLIGIVVALTSRFLSHFISGVVFFAEYAPPEMGPYIYSAIYNGSYVLGEMVISGIIIYLLWKRAPQLFNA